MNSRMGVSDHGLPRSFEDPRAVANSFDCHKKYFGKVSVHFKLDLNTPGLLLVSTNKNKGD